VLFASENPLTSIAPRCQLRTAGVDVGKALLHFIMPSTLNLGLRFTDAVEELKRQNGSFLVRKCLCVLEQSIGSLTHTETIPRDDIECLNARSW
jgi:hypothetical protein